MGTASTSQMPERRLRDRWSLRTRIVAIAALFVTAVLVVGGLLLGWALRQALIEDLRQAAVLRAQDLAAVTVRGALPDPIPVGDADEALVQVVTNTGVAAASVNAVALEPLDLPRPPVGQTALYRVQRLPVPDELDEGFMVAATTVATDTGPATVFVASALEDVNEALARAGSLALLALPLVVTALMAVMWLLVGWALAPVEAIRREADEINGQDLHRRVPEPPIRDEIGRLARTLNGMLSRLETSSDRQRRFVADAAHELRTPVASIRAQLETARDSPRSIDWAAVADDALEEAIRMQQLIDQLLVLAGADAASPPSLQQTVDLDDLVLRVASAYRDNADVQLDLASVQPIQVSGSPVLLEHAIRNLVENAYRHAHGRIAIHCRHEGASAVLGVDDDGPGVPTEHRARIFERFTRLDHARTRDLGGAGLGLAIVANIIALHGGEVAVSESPLGGARFAVRLPRN